MPHPPEAFALGAATLGQATIDIEPNTHILFRAQVNRGERDLDGTAQSREALELAIMVTGYGGMISELRRRPSDPDQSIHIAAVMTVAQAVEMLVDTAQEHVGARPYDASRTTPPAAPELDPISTWLGEDQEAVRAAGVPMLTEVLRLAGIPGDVEAAADHLWTACGY
jgi:hypothetical protein